MRNTVTKFLVGLCLMLLAVSGFAANGTWTNDANGDWGTAANWSGSTIATGADFTVTFTNITANRIVNLNNNWTIGHITAADVTHDFIITNNTLTLSVTSGSPLINVFSGRTLTISNVLAGADGMTKIGSGTLRLMGQNTYSGGTTITNGTLILDGAGQVNPATILPADSNLTISNATVICTNMSNVIANDTGGTITLHPGGLLSFASGASCNLSYITMNGGTITGVDFVVRNVITVTDDSLISADWGKFSGGIQTINVTNGKTLTVSGMIRNVGTASTYLKTGEGTLILSATNTYTGPTTISGGTLTISGSGWLGSGTYAAEITNNATFNYNSSADQTLSGIISGTGTLTKTNSSMLTLSGANTYTGRTAVSGGILMGKTGGYCTNSALYVTSGATNGVQVASTGDRWSCKGLTNTAYGITFDFNDIPSTNVAPMYVNGNVVISSATKFSIVATNVMIPVGTYPLISFSGSCTGAPSATPYSLPGGMTATISTNAGLIKLVVTEAAGNNLATNSGYWTNASIWSLSRVPIAYDIVSIGSDVMVTNNQASAAIASLSITGTLQISHVNAITNTAVLLMTNGAVLQLRANSSTTFNTPSTATNQGGTITIDVDNNGSGSDNTLTLGGGFGIDSAITASYTVNITGGNGYKLQSPVTLARPSVTPSPILIVSPTTAPLIITTLTHVYRNGGTMTLQLDGTNTANQVTEAPSSDWLYITQTGGTWTWSGDNSHILGWYKIGGGSKLILTGTITTYTVNRDIQLDAGGELDYNNAGAVDSRGGSSGEGDLVFQGGSLDNTSGSEISTSTYDPSIRWSSNFTFIGSSSLYLGSGSLLMTYSPTVTVSAATLTVGGPIYGTNRGLTKAGAGTLTVAGLNTYNGRTTVSNGTLIGMSGGYSTNSVVYVTDGATNGVRVTTTGGRWSCAGLTNTASGISFNFNVIPSTNVAPLYVNSNVVISSATKFSIVATNVTIPVGVYPLIAYSGSCTGTPSATPYSLPYGMSAVISNLSSNIYLYVTVSNTLPGICIKANNATNLNLAGSWVGGIVPIASDIAIWSNNISTSRTAAIGDNLSWAGIRVLGPTGTQTIAATAGKTLTLGTSGIDMTNASANLTIDAEVSLVGAQTWIVTNSRTLTVNGAVGGSAGLTLSGDGTNILSGTNTYTGPTTIRGGTLTISGSGQLGSGTYSERITNNAAFNYASSADQTLSGNISGTGSLTKTGAGTLTLSGTLGNTYSGPTVVDSGVLLLSKSASIDALKSGVVTVNNGATLRLGQTNQIDSGTVTNLIINAGGTFDLGDFLETMTRITAHDAAITGTSLGYLYVAQGYTCDGTNTFSQRISVRSASANSGLFIITDGTTLINATIYSDNATVQRVIKGGAGMLVLSGTNIYTGMTTVSNGTLLCMSGGHSTNSVLHVIGGSTNGVQVTSSNGRWACKGLTNTESSILFDFNVTPSTTVAPLYVNGDVTLNTTTKFSIIATNASIPAGTYPLISFTGACTGTPPTTLFSAPVGLVATISTNAGVINLNVTDTSTGSVSNGYATNVTCKSATLIGGVSNNTQTVEEVTLYWGPVDKGTNRTWAFTNNIGLITNPSSLYVTSSVSSLLATSTYYYAFAASNGVLGEIWGSPSKSFVTRPLGYLGSFSQLSWSNVNATTRLGVWTYPAQY